MQNDNRQATLPNGRAIQTPNPIQDIEYSISTSKLTPPKKQLLSEMLATIDMPDLRQQAFNSLFSRYNEQRDIDAFAIKEMLINLLILFSKEDVRKHIPNDVEDYVLITQSLYDFASTLDDDRFYLMREVQNLAAHGEGSRTVEDCHDRVFKNRSMRFHSVDAEINPQDINSRIEEIDISLRKQIRDYKNRG